MLFSKKEKESEALEFGFVGVLFATVRVISSTIINTTTAVVLCTT